MPEPFEAIKDTVLLKGMSLLDSVLSPEGIAFSIGAVSLLAGTTILKPFFSGGKKDWLTPFQAWKAGLYGDPKKGVTLGRYNGFLVCYEGDFPIGIDGTTGTGKTAGTFLSTLLSNELFSFIVFDQSGDLYKLTSGRRAKFGPVYRVDPNKFNSDCYNPFEDIPNDGRIISNLFILNSILFAGTADDQKRTGGDPFWDKKPKEVFPFIELQVLYGEDASKKNMRGILEFMDDGVYCFREMANNPRHPQCAAVGREMLQMPEQTRNSIVTTIKASLALWRDDNIARITSSSSFRMEDLATHEKGPITIYLTAPTTMIQRMMPFYVLMEEMLKIHLMDTTDKTLSGKKKVRPVCISDDEAQNSKRPSIDVLEVARKFGVKYLFGYQGINAMVSLYGEPKLDLIKMKLTYRPTVGGQVIQRLVEMSGTYKKKTNSFSEGIGAGKRSSRTTSWSIKDTPRMGKHEWEELPEFGYGLLTWPGKPALLETFDSKQDPEFSKLILPEYTQTFATIVSSEWANFSKPIIVAETSIPEYGPTEEECDCGEEHDEDGVVHDMQNPTGAMLMMMGEESQKEAIEYEQPAARKRSVSF